MTVDFFQVQQFFKTAEFDGIEGAITYLLGDMTNILWIFSKQKLQGIMTADFYI